MTAPCPKCAGRKVVFVPSWVIVSDAVGGPIRVVRGKAAGMPCPRCVPRVMRGSR